MPRALIGLLLVLQAPAARYTPGAIRLRATDELPSQHADLSLAMGGRHLGQFTLSYANGAALLAPRGPFGHTGPRIRFVHGMIGVDRDAGTDLVFADAVVALQEALGPELSPRVFVELLLGRAPDGRWSDDGRRVTTGPLQVVVDREGRPTDARLGEVSLRANGSSTWLRTGDLTLEIRWGRRVLRPIPATAFALDGRLL